MKRFGEILLGSYAVIVLGVVTIFLAPKTFGAALMTPLWPFNVFVALATFAYVGIRAVLIVQRWFSKLHRRESR